MPILGITDVKSRSASRGITRFGKIKKGAEKGDNRPGQDLDYFRVDFDSRYQYLEATFAQLYGDKPTEFEAILIGKTVDDVFDSWNISRTETKILHKCDGQTQALHWDDKQNKHLDRPIACAGGNKDGRYECSGKCVMQGTLSFSLPALNEIAGEFGKFTLTTHSFHDIDSISNQLALLETVVPTLMFLPVTIGRGMQTITRPDKQHGRAKMDKSLLYLRLKTEQIQRYIEEQMATPQLPDVTQLLDSGETHLLDSGDDATDDTEVWKIAEKTGNYLRSKGIQLEPRQIVDMWLNANCDPRNRQGDDKLEPIAVILANLHTDGTGTDYEAIEATALSLYGEDTAGILMDYVLALGVDHG